MILDYTEFVKVVPIIRDMPKLHSPFVRAKNEANQYVVTPVVEEDYSWVFEDPIVSAVEKLDGTCVSILIEDGIVKGVWNRGNRVPIFNRGTRNIIDGLLNSYDKGYLDMLTDGQWFGEVIGPKIQKNKYELDAPLWIPFKTYSHDKLVYGSWGKYPKTFESISEWFKDLESIFMSRRGHKGVQAEGIVFTHPDGRMAKLRRDMFDWYSGRRH